MISFKAKFEILPEPKNDSYQVHKNYTDLSLERVDIHWLKRTGVKCIYSVKDLHIPSSQNCDSWFSESFIGRKKDIQ